MFNVDCKIDGVSLSLIYKDNKLLKAITRGDGIIEKISHKMYWVLKVYPSFKNCKSKLIEIRGEVFYKKRF